MILISLLNIIYSVHARHKLVINIVDDEINNIDDDVLFCVQLNSFDINNNCVWRQNEFFSYQFVFFVDEIVEIDEKFDQIVCDQIVCDQDV